MLGSFLTRFVLCFGAGDQILAGWVGVRREQCARQEAHRLQARRTAGHQGVGRSAAPDEREYSRQCSLFGNVHVHVAGEIPSQPFLRARREPACYCLVPCCFSKASAHAAEDRGISIHAVYRRFPSARELSRSSLSPLVPCWTARRCASFAAVAA